MLSTHRENNKWLFVHVVHAPRAHNLTFRACMFLSLQIVFWHADYCVRSDFSKPSFLAYSLGSNPTEKNCFTYPRSLRTNCFTNNKNYILKKCPRRDTNKKDNPYFCNLFPRTDFNKKTHRVFQTNIRAVRDSCPGRIKSRLGSEKNRSITENCPVARVECAR